MVASQQAEVAVRRAALKVSLLNLCCLGNSHDESRVDGHVGCVAPFDASPPADDVGALKKRNAPYGNYKGGSAWVHGFDVTPTTVNLCFRCDRCRRPSESPRSPELRDEPRFGSAAKQSYPQEAIAA